MAGPGGGPPRRSHTKSRKGCETCKKRHIRCDENFPQCRNCTKHKIRCPYHDIPVPEERSVTPDKVDVTWSPEIQAAIDQWVLTGAFPFPGLNIRPAPDPMCLSVEEKRLVYHIASISHQLSIIDANDFTLWTRQIPTILRIGACHRYVLDALLAFSAMHVSFLHESKHFGNMAYEHRGRALRGLKEAIGTFSRETSDAILAASLVLSWQATDWKSWTQLMQGTSTVIQSMEPWKHESQFGDFIAESNTFPTAPPSPSPDHRSCPPRDEDLEVLQRAMHQLHEVESLLRANGENAQHFTELVKFVQGIREVDPNLKIAEQFERLQPLCRWLLWLPVLYLQQTNGSSTALLIIANYYAVALLMERLFPEIGAAYFGSLTVGPLEDIARRLCSISVSGAEDASSRMHLALMSFPMETVESFRSRMGWRQTADNSPFAHFGMPGFYAPPGSVPMQAATVPMQATPVTAEYLPYADNPPFSYSTEDLSVATSPEPVAGAVSPLQLSPFVNSQYLGVPSPSYGGYSPASSTYGDYGDASSVVYSDNEDFGRMEPALVPPGAIAFGGFDGLPTPAGHVLQGVTDMNTFRNGTPTMTRPSSSYLASGGFGDALSSSFSNLNPSPLLSSGHITSSAAPNVLAPPMAIPLRTHQHTASSVSAPPTMPGDAAGNANQEM